MNDTIYRQDAIDALHGYFDGMLETDTWSPCDVYWLIEILPSAQPSRELIEQIKWERDLAIQQLKDLGYGLGEKPKADGDVISRQAAIDALKRLQKDISGDYTELDPMMMAGCGYIGDCIGEIQDLPSAQPEIVMCKDCKYYVSSGWCEGRGTCVSTDDFCSRAERRTDG